MQIDIIAPGRVKERYLRDAIDEYSKRLSRYCKLNIIEVADEKTPDHASEGVDRQIKAREGERIAKHLKDGAFVIALAINGKQLSSEELAAKINDLGLRGTSHIQLVIGGSIGLDDAILRRADFLLSFSKMTFPHQLMRVILLEQIYRAYKINAGEPYHKSNAIPHGAGNPSWGGNCPMRRQNPHGAVCQNGLIPRFHIFFKPPHGQVTAR